MIAGWQLADKITNFDARNKYPLTRMNRSVFDNTWRRRTILKKNMTPEREAAYRQGLDDALNAGLRLLEKRRICSGSRAGSKLFL